MTRREAIEIAIERMTHPHSLRTTRPQTVGYFMSGWATVDARCATLLPCNCNMRGAVTILPGYKSE